LINGNDIDVFVAHSTILLNYLYILRMAWAAPVSNRGYAHLYPRAVAPNMEMYSLTKKSRRANVGNRGPATTATAATAAATATANDYNNDDDDDDDDDDDATAAVPNHVPLLRNFNEQRVGSSASGSSASNPSSRGYTPEMARTMYHSTGSITGRLVQPQLARQGALSILRPMCDAYNPMRQNVSISLKYNIKRDKDIIPTLVRYFTEADKPCPGTEKEIDMFVDTLQERYFGMKSFLYTARQPGASAEITDKYRNLARWFPPGFVPDVVPEPQGWTTLFPLYEMYLIMALNECCNSHIHKRKGREPPVVEKKYKARHDRWMYVRDRLVEYLQIYEQRLWWYPSTTTGLSIHLAIQQALDTLESARNKIFRRTYFNFDTKIPVGANIAFDFYKGVLHHATYIGNKYVVEVLGYNDNTTGQLKNYVTLTHIYEFIHRALKIDLLKNPSVILMRSFSNPYPADVLVSRAVSALGEYPGYDFMNENCETFCLWVQTNNWETIGECLTSRTRLPQDAAGLLSLGLLGDSSGGGGIYYNDLNDNYAEEDDEDYEDDEEEQNVPQETAPLTRVAGPLRPAGPPQEIEMVPLRRHRTASNLGGRVGGKRRTRRLRHTRF
jgi:hypothetical protein